MVAIAELNECFKVMRDVLGGVVILQANTRTTHFTTLDKEFSFGWYDSGRNAWELRDVQRLPEPIQAKGQQGLWNWEVIPSPEDERTDKPIKFRAIKDIYWDDWGQFRRVFVKGRIYEGVQHSDGSVSGHSPYYDVSDGLDPGEYELI